jgi:NAD(P)H-dependent FMN reductase
MLEEAGHDILALDRAPELQGLDDETVLALAANDDRVLVTHDVTDFPRILREWAAADRSHAGVILVYGIRHGRFRAVADAVLDWLERRPQQAEWRDLVVAAPRAGVVRPRA